MAHTVTDATNELHECVRAAWLKAPELVPFEDLSRYGIVYSLRDKDKLPDDAKRRPWCRVTVVYAGAGRTSIGGRRRTVLGQIVTQIFVPSDKDTAGGISLRLAEVVKHAYEDKKGFVNFRKIRFDGNGESGGYASALVSADFWYEDLRRV